MDIGIINARISQMRDVSASIARSAGRVNDAIEAAESEIRAVGADRYSSPAADEFRREYQRLTPRLREAYHQLLSFQDKLNRSADEIEAASRPTD
jgi:WXG100 family type VII secretion target